MTDIAPVIRKDDCGFTFNLNQSRVTLTALRAIGEDAYIKAHEGMLAIEAGAIKNPDEGRAVTHFTDRAAYPGSALCEDVEDFFTNLRAGNVLGCTGKPIDAVIINGIGGSALGPQLLQFALRGPCWNELRSDRRSGARIYFTDNTDSSGLSDILESVDLTTTLVVNISKSGNTQETRNNMLTLEAEYVAQGLDFAQHAAAITMEGSKLDVEAKAKKWRKIWGMADSIGGRTSVTAVVGHVPAAAAGIDFKAFLGGALCMDEWTRDPDLLDNPAYLLAAAWYVLGDGKGNKNMVIVPYSDRLVLFARYLQQLVMESLGKELDLDGKTVHQGLSVFGNKGGTDAHAFIQQLNDGRNDFFATFIEVLEDQAEYPIADGLTMGDYLHTFMQGLMNALASKERSVIGITVDALNERSLGMLIALYERAVAYYAELIHVNAFHQPGVEAYKKISKGVNDLALKIQAAIADHDAWTGSAAEFAAEICATAQAAEVEGLLAKFAVNRRSFGGKTLKRAWRGENWLYAISV